MRNFFETRRRILIAASFALSMILSSYCAMLFYNQTQQWQDYMLGKAYYIALQYNWASQAFEASNRDYEMASQSTRGPFDAPPSLEMAELALHFKALCEAKMGTEGKMKNAVEDFKAALSLTTKHALDEAEKDGRLDSSRRSKVEKDRLDDQVNIEIVLNNKPQLAKAQGKGKGNGDSDEKKSDDPSAAGNQAGKPTREEM